MLKVTDYRDVDKFLESVGIRTYMINEEEVIIPLNKHNEHIYQNIKDLGLKAVFKFKTEFKKLKGYHLVTPESPMDIDWVSATMYIHFQTLCSKLIDHLKYLARSGYIQDNYKIIPNKWSLKLEVRNLTANSCILEELKLYVDEIIEK